MANSSAQSILDLLLNIAAERPDQIGAMVKRGGAYQQVSWGEIAQQAQTIAAGLIGIGVAPGDRVCLIARTRLDWVTCDMGIIGAAGVTVAIYPTSLADDCQFIADDSGAVVVIAEDEGQVDKLRAEHSRLANVKRVVQIDGDVPADDGWVISLEQLRQLGVGHMDDLPARRAALTPESILTLIYTSGTTGRPKGVVMTHAAMLWEAQQMATIDMVRTTDVQLLFLPLAHSYAKMLEVGWLATRHVLAFAESLDSVQHNLAEVRPTLVAAVPRFFEKIHAAIVERATRHGGFKRSLFNLACDLSEKNGQAEARGERLGAVDRARFAVLKATVFRRIARGLSRSLGGRIRAMGSGGAPISPALLWFLRDAGLLVLEGYGLTETGAGGFVNQPGKQRIGTVGQILPGMEAKTAEDGEILLRGPNILREYWNRPEQTRAVLDADGWFHSGDIGELDAEGYLRITDRKKDIIITAGGKNIAPQKIENMLKDHALVSQAMVHGDRRKYLTALITLDADALAALCAERSLGDGAYAVMTQKPEVSRAVDEVVAAVNKRLASFETIKRFKVLPQDFTEGSGELTPTLKVKRRVITARYQAILDGFYDGSS